MNMGESIISTHIEIPNQENLSKCVINIAVLCCSIESNNSTKSDDANNIRYRLVLTGDQDLSALNFSKLDSIVKQAEKVHPDSYSEDLGGLNIAKTEELISQINEGSFSDNAVFIIDTDRNVIGVVTTTSDDRVEEIGSIWIDRRDGHKLANINSFRGKNLAKEMYSLISEQVKKPSIMVTQGLDAIPPNFAMLSIAAKNKLLILDTKDGSVFTLSKRLDENDNPVFDEDGNPIFDKNPSNDIIKKENWENYFSEKYHMKGNYMDPGDYIVFGKNSYDKIFNLGH